MSAMDQRPLPPPPQHGLPSPDGETDERHLHDHTGAPPLAGPPNDAYVQYAPYTGPPAAPPPSELGPFLGLGPRLLLTFFNPAILPLCFTIAHLANTRASTAELAGTLRDKVRQACEGVASGAAALQALPRYLAMQTNRDIIRATRATVLAVGKVLMDCITIIEKVVGFLIDMYRSILMCTIQLVVQGSLELLISAVQTISDAVTSSLNSIRTSIQEDIASFNSIKDKAVELANDAIGWIHPVSIGDIDIPQLAFLENVTIPTGFEDSLIKLNASLPTLEEVRDKLEAILNVPFEELKKEINTTRLDIAAQLNDSILPVPSLQALGSNNTQQLNDQLCGDLDMSLIDDTAKSLHSLGTIAIGVMCALVVLAWAILAFWQWRRWCALKDSVEVVHAEWTTQPPNAWTVVAVVEHPVIERYGRPVMDKLHLGPRGRTNFRWFVSYLAHPTCLTLFLMSIVGLIFLQVQLAALDGLKSHVAKTANESMSATTSDLVGRINALSANASAEYAADMNRALAKIEEQINGKMLGGWINTTAITLNETIVEFYADIENVLNMTFYGTPLFNPINNFAYCLLGSKVDAIEAGLKWVSEHAQVSLPLIPDDILEMGNDTAGELASPVAANIAGTGKDDGAVGQLIGHFEAALRAERLVYAVLLALYLLLVLVGLGVVLWYSGGRERAKRFRRDEGDNGDLGGSGLVRSFRNIGGRRLPTPTATHPRAALPDPGTERKGYYDEPRSANIESTFSFLHLPWSRSSTSAPIPTPPAQGESSSLRLAAPAALLRLVSRPTTPNAETNGSWVRLPDERSNVHSTVYEKPPPVPLALYNVPLEGQTRSTLDRGCPVPPTNDGEGRLWVQQHDTLSRGPSHSVPQDDALSRGPSLERSDGETSGRLLTPYRVRPGSSSTSATYSASTSSRGAPRDRDRDSVDALPTPTLFPPTNPFAAHAALPDSDVTDPEPQGPGRRVLPGRGGRSIVSTFAGFAARRQADPVVDPFVMPRAR